MIRRLGSIFIAICFLFGIDKALSQTHSSDPPLARIDGKIITVQEFMQGIIKLSPSLRANLKTEEDKRLALDRVIDWKLMVADAIRKGLDKEPKVEVTITAAREQIIVSEYINQYIRDKVVIAETDLQEYYAQNRDEFKVSEAIKVSHILVKSETEAREILEQLKNGADFGELAHEKSLDPSKRNGGQMGWLERRVMESTFANAAFSLTKGEMSGVVHSPFGYHIIKVDDKQATQYAAYEQVKEAIKEKIRRKAAHEMFEQVKKELRSKAEITIDKELLNTIRADGDTEISPVR